MDSGKKTAKQIVQILAPLSLFSLSPFLASLHIYLSNSTEFSLPISALVLFNGLLFCLALLFLFAIVIFLPRKVQNIIISVFAGLGVLFWIQGSLLNWDYGVLTGVPIDWDAYRIRLIIDLLIWSAVLACFIYFSQKIRPHLTFICVLLLLIQTAGLFVSYIHNFTPPSHQSFIISEHEKMKFSKDKNVVILLLDAFQTDVFQEIIDTNPKYSEIFEGFTFFRNTTAQYSKTYGAIPALLTGHWYENNLPVETFLNTSFKDAVSTVFLQNGWLSQLYPLHKRVIGYSQNYASNIESKTNLASFAQEAGKLLDIGFFRTMPQPLKPFWLNHFQWRMANIIPRYLVPDKTTKNVPSNRKQFFHPIQEFVHQCRSELSEDSQRPTFKFFHFNIPHSPFVLNESLEYECLPVNREGFLRYSTAGLESMRVFLQALKKKGIYDQTMVLVLSDHGGGEYHTGIRNTIAPAKKGSIDPMHHASGLPLLLVKPFSAQHEKLETSDAPVSLGDILPTIATATDINKEYPGYNLFSVPEDLQRTRRYIFYSFEGWEHDYLPEMVEYEITGHAWDPSAWNSTGKIYSPPETNQKEKTATTSGLKADKSYFFTDNTHTGFLGKGWSFPEPQGTWSHLHEAVLELPIKNDIQFPVKISFWLSAFKCGETVNAQRVHVFSENGDTKPLHTWNVSEPGWYSILISKNDMVTDRLKLIFKLPDAISPMDCRIGPDERNLAVSLRELKLKTMDPLNASGKPGPLRIDFSETGSSSKSILSGWSGQETDWRWTDGSKAAMAVNLETKPDQDLVLWLLGRGYLHNGQINHQKVKLVVNNKHIADWSLGETFAWHEARVPATVAGDKAVVKIVFEISDPAAPQDFGPSSDMRLLGMAVREITILMEP